jgi:phage-related protein
MMDKWSLKFVTNISDITAFLRAQGGQASFNWTNPLGVSGMYVCREWKVGHVGAEVFDLTCDFEQVPA